MKKFLFLFLFQTGILFQCLAQNGYERWDTLAVTNSGIRMKNPWAGGLNWPQFSPIDLDGNGVMDLFVFDRSCNCVRTFINGGTAGQVDYHYAPQYESKFPVLHDFALLADYNCDGKNDIFTFSAGGMALYRNDFTIASGLQFTKVTSLIMSNYGTTTANLYIQSNNLPAIADMDGDGDIDILTIDVLGSRIEYHQNMSKDLYNSCDSVSYRMSSGCWGNIALSSSANTATLNVPCRLSGGAENTNSTEHHGGATLLALDLNGDGKKELVVGDLGFTNLLLLTNGGSATSANVISVDQSFPLHNGAASAVNLSSMPCAFSMDVNNDGLNDLIVAPNEINISENFHGILYFRNRGTNAVPDYQYVQNDFLQNEMIDNGEGANPIFFDADGDGLQDLIIGNYGYYNPGTYTSGLSYLKNTGTAQNPSFDFVSRNYANVNAQGLNGTYPTFGDLDHDGDKDMIVGDYNGNLHLYSNLTGDSIHPANFMLTGSNYFGIDVGNNAAPQLIDLDRDGKLDLVVGKRNGKISYYRNTGTSQVPDFSDTVTTFLGKVKVVDLGTSITGYAAPFFFDTPSGYKLFVGSERGYVYYYDHIDGNLGGTFNLVDSVFLGSRLGCRVSVGGADIHACGRTDLVIGNYGGGAVIFRNDLFTGMAEMSHNELQEMELYPVPSDQFVSIRIGQRMVEPTEICIYSISGQLIFETQTWEEKLSIHTSDIPGGIYFCRIISQNQVQTGKLIIAH